MENEGLREAAARSPLAGYKKKGLSEEGAKEEYDTEDTEETDTL